MKSSVTLSLAITAALALTTPAFAGVITAVNGPQGTFTVSSTDLGQASGTTMTLDAGTADFSSSVTKLNDGLIYNAQPPVNTTESFTPSNGAVVTFHFSTGQQIDSIVSLSAYIGNRTAQVYDVAYQAVGSGTFTTFASVTSSLTNNSELNGEVQVSITSLGLTNVGALKFTFHNGPVGDVVYREIDINAATVPEPSSLALSAVVALCGGAACWHRRRG